MRMRTVLDSLRARLLLFVTLAVLPALIAIVYSGLQQRNAAEDHAREQALIAARHTADEIANVREDSLLILSILTKVPEVAALSPSDCDSFLARLLRDHPEFANIGVISDVGLLVCSARPTAHPVYLGDRGYFKNVIASKTMVTGMYQVGRVLQVPAVVFAAPVLGARSSVHAVAFVSLELRWLNQMASRTSIPAGTSLLVLDRRGFILVRQPDPEKWVGHKAADFCNPHHPDCMKGEGFITNAWPDGVRRLYGYRSLQDPDGATALTILYGIPQSQIVEAARNALITHLGILGVILFFIYLFAWYGSDALVLQNLKVLLAAIKDIQAGKTDARADIPGRHELALIGNAFNDMAENLATKSRQISTQLERIRRLLRIYRVFSAINGSILRTHAEEELVSAACRIAVEQGGFKIAWIGQVDQQTQWVTPVAHAGIGRDAVYALRISAREDIPEGQGTAGTALRTREPAIDNDIATSTRLTPWRHELLGLGCHSLASFPLLYGNELYGNLSLYAAERNFFDEEEVRLLRQLAADTAIGLKNIRTETALRQLSYFDPITDLPNRRLFEDRTGQILARARRDHVKAMVLAVQIEEVHRIEDALGRHVVDGLLQEIATRLKARVDSSDSIAKLSRDIFALCLIVYPGEDVLGLSAKIMQLFPLQLTAGGEPVVISAWAGAALFPADGDTAATLIRNAEVSLRNPARESGAVCSFYSSGMDIQADRRFSLEKELHFAIERNELSLVYQPIFDLPGRRVIGAEALLRWTSQALGPVSPAEFIPIAEQAGLIVSIGEWVLREGCTQALKWYPTGSPTFRVSVNVSLIQLHESDFLGRLKEILATLKFDPKIIPLAVEITESEMAYNVEETISILQAIRALGIHIYMDDFGTGYSSLGYLKRMPIHALKIDRIFVKDLDNNSGDKEFMRVIVSLAKSLGLSAIAEGVETERQLAILESLGCEAIQGYLLGYPVPPDGISALLGKGFA